MMGRDGASLGSAKQRSQMLIHEWVLLYERWTLWNQLSNILKKKCVFYRYLSMDWHRLLLVYDFLHY